MKVIDKRRKSKDEDWNVGDVVNNNIHLAIIAKIMMVDTALWILIPSIVKVLIRRKNNIYGEIPVGR